MVTFQETGLSIKKWFLLATFGFSLYLGLFLSDTGNFSRNHLNSVVFQSPVVSDSNHFKEGTDPNRVVIVVQNEGPATASLSQSENAQNSLEFVAWNVLISSSTTAALVALAIYLQRRKLKGGT